MTPTRSHGRTMMLALMFGGLTTLAAPAIANDCGDAYTVKPGDTLGAIAKRCDTTVAALIEVNGVDPRGLQIGQTLALSTGGLVVRESAKVRPAELDAEALAAEQAAKDAERARFVKMERDYPDPRISAKAGEWRQSVDLTAAGLAPGEIVRVAVAGRSSEWITLGDLPAGDDGRFDVRARIPAALAREAVLRFAMERPWGAIAGVEYGRNVVSNRSRTRDGGRIVSVSGTVVSGGACDLLITGQGVTYALDGDVGIAPGDSVRITGVERSAGGENCVGDRAGIKVEAVRLL